MQSFKCLILFGLALILFTACEKEEPSSKVDEDGLTQDIIDLIPAPVLAEMKAQGMPIYGGDNPPNIENTYLGSPFILESSNRPSDFPGMQFADYQLTFYGQNNEDLTIQVDYLNGPESGEGLGSFIVGDGCQFTVVMALNSMNSGTPAKIVHVISGTKVNNGIRQMRCANFMVDDFGDPLNVWIEVGEGRVIFDQDGFSEIVGSSKQWYASLPDCPCEYTSALDERREMCGTWKDCGPASDAFHYGATYEIRWAPDQEGPGQQCTYDKDKRLITGGIAAGSPDKVSPGSCGWAPLNEFLATHACWSEHCELDVIPWKEEPCWKYLADWLPNAGKGCGTSNVVSGIDHMRPMIGDLTCYEATQIIRKAAEAPAITIDPRLRDYILNVDTNLSRSELLLRLKNWQDRQWCSQYPTDEFCVILAKAVANLE